MMSLGVIILELVAPLLELLAPYMPGDTFPSFFKLEMAQRSLIAAVMVTIVAGYLGLFLIMKNQALMGDGLAHVSFGGIALGVVLGASSPLWYALLFAVIASVCINELQSRDILTGDASIAIFLTGMLALGLVILKVWEGEEFTGIAKVHAYLFGNLLLMPEDSLDLIALVCVLSFVLLAAMRNALLTTSIDPLAARIQGIPVRRIELLFGIITAAVVVSMVKVVGALLVTALLVTPAATAKQISSSFKSCIFMTQAIGLISVMSGIYISSEMNSGTGSTIALVAAIIFIIVVISKSAINVVIRKYEN